jgi:transcriptional regulator with XRE-family HTH domain
MDETQLAGTEGFGQRLAQERRLKAVREERDIDQKDVAAAVGTSPTNVSRWERGLVVPGDDNIQKLAKYFGVTPGWLRYGVGGREAVDVIVRNPDGSVAVIEAKTTENEKGKTEAFVFSQKDGRRMTLDEAAADLPTFKRPKKAPIATGFQRMSSKELAAAKKKPKRKKA